LFCDKQFELIEMKAIKYLFWIDKYTILFALQKQKVFIEKHFKFHKYFMKFKIRGDKIENLNCMENKKNVRKESLK